MREPHFVDVVALHRVRRWAASNYSCLIGIIKLLLLLKHDAINQTLFCALKNFFKKFEALSIL